MLLLYFRRRLLLLLRLVCYFLWARQEQLGQVPTTYKHLAGQVVEKAALPVFAGGSDTQKKRSSIKCLA